MDLGSLLIGGLIVAGALALLRSGSARAQQSYQSPVTPLTGPVKVAVVGDSLSSGAYPKYLQAFLGNLAIVRTYSKVGAGTETIYLGPYRDALAAGIPDVLVLLAGVNDINNGRAVSAIMETLNRMYDLGGYQTAQGKTPRVVAVQLTPWGCYRGTSAMKQTRTQLLNDLIASSPFPTVVVRTDALGDGTGCLAAPYSSDGLHMTDAGYKALAQLVAEGVRRVL